MWGPQSHNELTTQIYFEGVLYSLLIDIVAECILEGDSKVARRLGSIRGGCSRFSAKL
jgi:hypothetical protein